jgi:hypothetical protein
MKKEEVKIGLTVKVEGVDSLCVIDEFNKELNLVSIKNLSTGMVKKFFPDSLAIMDSNSVTKENIRAWPNDKLSKSREEWKSYFQVASENLDNARREASTVGTERNIIENEWERRKIRGLLEDKKVKATKEEELKKFLKELSPDMKKVLNTMIYEQQLKEKEDGTKG